ncbi:hypothetical protein MHX64_11485, partial [Corynebacterium sp. ACRPZ]|nr:hypothetical protein [Corynebacterium sp. ACRPZ]
MSETAFTQLSTYIDSRRDHLPDEVGEALARAREDAEENGVPVPSQVVGDLLSVLAAGNEASQGAVAVTPAAGVAGLHILTGLREKATLGGLVARRQHGQQIAHDLARNRHAVFLGVLAG